MSGLVLARRYPEDTICPVFEGTGGRLTQHDAEEWARLSRLLDEALDREPATRAGWIDTLGPELESLKPQLRDLLSRAASVETHDFLGTLPKIGDAAINAERPGMAGEIVGAYRLVRELGVGGMGSVWLAERTDGLINRARRPQTTSSGDRAPRGACGAYGARARDPRHARSSQYRQAVRCRDHGRRPAVSRARVRRGTADRCLLRAAMCRLHRSI